MAKAASGKSSKEDQTAKELKDLKADYAIIRSAVRMLATFGTSAQQEVIRISFPELFE